MGGYGYLDCLETICIGCSTQRLYASQLTLLMQSLLLPSPSGTVAMTPTGPTQFSPASDPVPSGKAPFVGNILAFHTLSGAKFIVTYANHALNNSPPISAVVNDKNEMLVEK